MLTDAVNEVILSTTRLDDITVRVNGNKLLLSDEFGTMSAIFTDADPNLIQKVRRFWGDFLQRRSQKLGERLRASDDSECWYEVGGARADTIDEAVALYEENPAAPVYRYTRRLVDLSEEVVEE